MITRTNSSRSQITMSTLYIYIYTLHSVDKCIAIAFFLVVFKVCRHDNVEFRHYVSTKHKKRSCFSSKYCNTTPKRLLCILKVLRKESATHLQNPYLLTDTHSFACLFSLKWLEFRCHNLDYKVKNRN